jgi:hypothetical protein
MSNILNFNFNINSPDSYTKTIIVNDSPYVAHCFLKIPIYDNFNTKIGYKVAEDYIQELSDNKYAVTINSTYYFINNNSTISWQFNFINNLPNYYYPLNQINSSNITATTGEYFGKTGIVSLIAKEDGSRDVTISFNFN